ncbi:MAG: APC family permease, partial [Woeseiaceae bacterium]
MTHIKTLGQRDIVLFTVSAILLLDTLAAGATVGASSVFWWLFLGVVFFVPYALICSELGTTYPEQGGLYAWIRDAFGRRWASRATWAYWVNTSVWMPAIFILFAGIFSQVFMPDLSLRAQIGIGIGLTWIAVAVNVVTLDIGKWIPNVGAVLKIIVMLALVGGAILYTTDHGMANPLTISSMTPNWGNSLQYLSVIIYGMLGFELVSAGSEEMKNPARDIPAGIFISGLIIIVLYTATTIAILAAIPAGDINLVEGLMETLYLFFGTSGTGHTFAVALGAAALFTFFSNGVTWALGCNRAMAEAAAEREFPALLAYEHRRFGTPVGAALVMGLISTAVLVLYSFLAASK